MPYFVLVKPHICFLFSLCFLPIFFMISSQKTLGFPSVFLASWLHTFCNLFCTLFATFVCNFFIWLQHFATPFFATFSLGCNLVKLPIQKEKRIFNTQRKYKEHTKKNNNKPTKKVQRRYKEKIYSDKFFCFFSTFTRTAKSHTKKCNM